MIGSQDVVLTESLEVKEFENRTDQPENESADETLLLNSPLVEELSVTHVGAWNSLVSRTNWEKGAVILRWRESMATAELPKSAWSDEAWARRVGNVTAQHVGRLRRVSERFAGKEADYPNLYWSHFQTALDWEDAEMWLEGAVQNGWSVAQMRIQRWEAIGAPAELKPRSEDVFLGEIDEDVNPRNDSYPTPSADRTEARTSEIGPADIIEGFDSDTPPFEVDGDDDAKKELKKTKAKNNDLDANGPSTGELLATLKDFSGLPDDLAESLESLKVAILNHKLGGWKDCSPPKLLKKIDALKALVSSIDE